LSEEEETRFNVVIMLLLRTTQLEWRIHRTLADGYPLEDEER